jgi:hypothetical protein
LAKLPLVRLCTDEAFFKKNELIMHFPRCWRTRRQAATPRLARVFQMMLSIALVVGVPLSAERQGPRVLPPDPMIDGGKITLSSSALSVDVLKYSGTAARLTPQADPGHVYTPGDLFKQRSADTYYHPGDLDMRFRTVGSTAGSTDVFTAFRRWPVAPISSDATHLTGEPHPKPSRGHAAQGGPHLGRGGWRPGAALHAHQHLGGTGLLR